MKKILLVLLILSISAPAYSLTGISFGIKGGIAKNTDLGPVDNLSDIDQMKLIGGQVKIATLPVVDFIGSVDYAWAKERYTGIEGDFKFHDLSLSLSVVYPFKQLQTIKPFAGIGIGTHALGYSFEGSGASVFIPANESFFGYHLIYGFDLGFPAFPFTITAEGRINYVKTDGGNTKYLQFTAGLNYSLL